MIDIGSSEAPAVLGVSPHLTPWQLWARKVGLLPDTTEETEVMRRGRQLERTIVDMFVSDQKYPTYIESIGASPHTTRWLQDLPWHRSTPDAVFLVDGVFTLVEVKAIVGHPPAQPRADWLVQCLHQRQGYSEATRQFLVCFGNLTLTWWELPKHQRAMDRVLREEERFLERVIKHDPPPVRAADASILGKAWPITTKEPVELDARSQWVAEHLTQIRSTAKNLENAAAEYEAELKAKLADHEEGVFPNGGRITWKPYTRKGYVVQDQTVRRLTIKTNGGTDD